MDSGKAEIISDPDIMMGKPVIKGTRVTVEIILEKLGAGESIEDLLEAYPHVTREGLQAAFGYAEKALRSDVIYPVAG